MKITIDNSQDYISVFKVVYIHSLFEILDQIPNHSCRLMGNVFVPCLWSRLSIIESLFIMMVLVKSLY